MFKVPTVRKIKIQNCPKSVCVIKELSEYRDMLEIKCSVCNQLMLQRNFQSHLGKHKVNMIGINECKIMFEQALSLKMDMDIVKRIVTRGVKPNLGNVLALSRKAETHSLDNIITDCAHLIVKKKRDVCFVKTMRKTRKMNIAIVHELRKELNFMHAYILQEI